MPTIREFFATEASEVLTQLGSLIERLDSGSGEAGELQRQTRALRGSAQMARDERVYRAAHALEAAARSVAVGVLSWGQDVSTRVRRTLEDIEALVRADE